MSDTKRVRITSETHEHEGKPFKSGEYLEVSAKTADHLVALKAAEHAPAAPTKTAKSTTEGGD
jgi:hypothetical protein